MSVKEGHYKRDRKQEVKKDFALAVADNVDAIGQWILDSGSSRHLVTHHHDFTVQKNVMKNACFQMERV